MPLINSLEVANFMNRERRTPFEPTWPHTVFPLLGMNSIINILNGRGKTTIVKLILFLLAGNRREINKLRQMHFAPRSSGSYTHVRLQVILDTEERAGFDLVSGTPLGQQMVFGIYGRLGENEEFKLYSYKGTLEDCPVHRMDTGYSKRVRLISDKEFEERLSKMPYKFPASANESSAKSWREEIERWFDIASIEQQIVYQSKAGAEGSSSFFDVGGKDNEFAANVFYERLAPELLHDVMGGKGEEGEKNIEDTIHEKTRQVIHARLRNADTAKSLEHTSQILNEINQICELVDEMAQAEARYNERETAFAIELGVLEDAIITRPFPGFPPQPPAEFVKVAQYIVLCEGKPYITDRGVASFSGEEPKVINRQADRNGIYPAPVENSQLVEITCHHGETYANRKQGGGPSSKFYSCEAAIGIIAHTEKFLPEWDRDSAIAMVRRVFEWAEHADTNPAREAKKEHDIVYAAKKAERDAVDKEMEKTLSENMSLMQERVELGKHGAEYQRMQESGLFSPAELEAPAETGRKVIDEERAANAKLDEHKFRVSKLENVYEHWKQFVAEHGTSASPESILEDIIREEADAKTLLGRLIVDRDELSRIGKSLKAATREMGDKYNDVRSRLTKAEKAYVKAADFETWFKGEDPESLEAQVRAEFRDATEQCHLFEKELSVLEEKLEDITEFKRRFGPDVDPVRWLKNRDILCEKLREVKGEAFHIQKQKSAELKSLEQFSVAPAQFACDVQDNVMTEFVPLHAAVEAMGFDETRKRTLLTLFSALLFAPVLPDAASAETAARNLAEKRFEFPVFIAADLEKFCRYEDLTLSNNSVRSLFIGVKTQNVECLLDPELLERRKAEISGIIARSIKKQKLLEKAIARTSLEAVTVKLAVRVCHAIETHAVESAERIKGLLDPLRETLPRLAARSSDIAIDSIRAMREYNQALKGMTFEALKVELLSAEEKFGEAEQVETSNEVAISEINSEIDSANGLVNVAGIKRIQQEPILEGLAVFIADTEFGPEFMNNAQIILGSLKSEFEDASRKAKFRFDDAQLFADTGINRMNAITTRLQEIEARRPYLEDQKLKLAPEVTNLQEIGLALNNDITKVDGVARKMIRLYRRHRCSDLPSVDISRHDLFRDGSFIRNCTSVRELIARIVGLEDDIESITERIDTLSSELKETRSDYDRSQSRFHRQIENTINNETLKLEEHVVILLQQAKSNPSGIRGVLNAARVNFEKDMAAHEVAKKELDSEWDTISSWLSEFTRRIPSNLDLMKNRFSPKKGQNQNFINAGFLIDAQIISHNDIEDVLKDIVKEIEDYEESKYLKNHREVRDDAQKGFRNHIRNEFYRRVILNPTIKVFIPSISSVKPLPLTRGIASSGQSVAISLLWIVKMSDYVSARERATKTVSMSAMAKKKLQSISSQFVFIDGAFSHLSDPSLIDDVLGEIENTRGKFQLIVTGHDPDYKPNWKLFPTMLNGREVGGRFMYVEKGVPVEPGTVGSNYGAMTMLRTHVIKAGEEHGPATY